MFLNVLSTVVVIVSALCIINTKWKEQEYNQSPVRGLLAPEVFYVWYWVICFIVSGSWLISVYLETGKIF